MLKNKLFKSRKDYDNGLFFNFHLGLQNGVLTYLQKYKLNSM